MNQIDKRAIDHLNQSLKVNSEYLPSLFLLTEFYIDSGKFEHAELNIEKRKVSLSIKLLEELQNKEAVSKFSSPLSGKNLPFSSLSEKLDDKKKKDDK